MIKCIILEINLDLLVVLLEFLERSITMITNIALQSKIPLSWFIICDLFITMIVRKLDYYMALHDHLSWHRNSCRSVPTS